MKETRRVMVYTCDACGRTSAHIDEREVHGFFGGVVLHASDSGGIRTPNWYACSEQCVLSAVLHALDGARRDGP